MILSWPSASYPIELGDDVHVWAWRTIPTAERDSLLNAILSAEERERADRFRFPEDRQRYLTCHANLRTLLARYAGCEPQGLSFITTEFGKPALKNPAGCELLRFNLSHSQDIGLLAVTRVAAIGADVERIRPIEREVAEAHFSKRELEDLASLDAERWLDGFFNCWTRKEAVLKAEGCGLNTPLDAFDVTLLPGESAVLREARPEARISQSWRLEHLQPAPEVVGAIAVGGSFSKLRYFRFAG
ncbi:MAG: 4'-phosphopantetheinyl transferase superfamily protein [Silvibacterium sp.]